MNQRACRHSALAGPARDSSALDPPVRACRLGDSGHPPSRTRVRFRAEPTTYTEREWWMTGPARCVSPPSPTVRAQAPCKLEAITRHAPAQERRRCGARSGRVNPTRARVPVGGQFARGREAVTQRVCVSRHRHAYRTRAGRLTGITCTSAGSHRGGSSALESRVDQCRRARVSQHRQFTQPRGVAGDAVAVPCGRVSRRTSP
jgi:hypothetical protein